MNEERLLNWIHQNDRHYHPNAYQFVLEALRYTQCHFKKPRHVTGQELLMGIARFAREKYGTLAYLVFEEWGVRTGKDFGRIVFNLIEMGEVKKTEKDCLEDFDTDFDLKKELEEIETFHT